MKHLRVATLNIWNKAGPWLERTERIRSDLAALSPDILALQEVLELESPSSYQCQTEELIDGMDLHHCYGLGHDMSGDWVPSEHRLGFGNAVVSRFPIRSSVNLRLPGEDISDQRRSLLHAVVEAPFADVDVFVTHLNWKLDEGWVRERQVQFIAAQIAERAPADGRYPPLLMGDMNAEPYSDEIRFLTGHTRLGNEKSTRMADVWSYFPELGPGFTFDARRNRFSASYHEPPRRLDYIFARAPGKKGLGAPIRAGLCFNTPGEGVPPIFPSDHFGVMADLRV